MNENFAEGESLVGILRRLGVQRKTIDLEKVLAYFFVSLNKWMRESDRKKIIQEYKNVLGGMNQDVKIMPQRKEKQDVFYIATSIDISPQGNLIVKRKDNGEEIELMSEEVSLRPLL